MRSGIYPIKKGCSGSNNLQEGRTERSGDRLAKEREKKIHRGDTEKERRIKRLVYHKTRKRNEDEEKVLKRDQEKGGVRERKTEWERKACIHGRAYICTCVYLCASRRGCYE